MQLSGRSWAFMAPLIGLGSGVRDMHGDRGDSSEWVPVWSGPMGRMLGACMQLQALRGGWEELQVAGTPT